MSGLNIWVIDFLHKFLLSLLGSLVLWFSLVLFEFFSLLLFFFFIFSLLFLYSLLMLFLSLSKLLCLSHFGGFSLLLSELTLINFVNHCWEDTSSMVVELDGLSGVVAKEEDHGEWQSLKGWFHCILLYLCRSVNTLFVSNAVILYFQFRRFSFSFASFWSCPQL